MKFESLPLSPQLIEALRQEAIVSPLPIQRLVIPAALGGGDLLVHAQTGSGKTLAYLLPLLQSISLGGGTKALILSPTRELAQQIASVCESLSAGVSGVVVGGVEYAQQVAALESQPPILVATPGRLIDLLEQGLIELSSLEYFVLDEVDQMLDLGFRAPITQLSTLRSPSAQTMCFSATMPQNVMEIAKELAPGIELLRIADETLSVGSVDHFGYYVSFEMMDRLLIHLLRSEAAQQAIIFTRSRKMADRVVGLLAQNSFTAEAMHSDRSQAAREHILSRFRTGETSIIVATDVIARGIDIDTVTHVFNFGLPQNPEQYIHRCGRVGRAGRSGRAISLFTVSEKPMLDQICRLMKRHVVIDLNHPYMSSDVTKELSAKKK